MSSSLSNLFATTEEHARELPMSPYAFGGIAMLGFLLLLGVLWSFRGTAARLSGEHLPHHSEDGTH